MSELIVYDGSVDFAVGAWLHEKFNRTGSEKTKRAYERNIRQFRAALLGTGLDLDGEGKMVALVLQAWAGGKAGSAPSAATVNQRIAIVSSFYRYAQRHDLLGVGSNPCERVERRPEQPYRNVKSLDIQIVRQRLLGIPRDSLAGKRDVSILLLALTTGRRVSEISGVTLSDIEASGSGVTLTFRAKGGKVMRDKLHPTVARALQDYLLGLSTAGMPLMANEPIWLSFSRNSSYGSRLSNYSVAAVCERWLGTSKFHSLRHTFAHAMEDAGAKVSDIQARLGHSNIATTGKYLTALRSDENKFSDALAQLFIGE